MPANTEIHRVKLVSAICSLAGVLEASTSPNGGVDAANGKTKPVQGFAGFLTQKNKYFTAVSPKTNSGVNQACQCCL